MEAIPFVARAVDAARMAGVPVIWVCREHHRSGVDVEQTRKHLFEQGRPGICVAGEPGAQVVKPLSVGDGAPPALLAVSRLVPLRLAPRPAAPSSVPSATSSLLCPCGSISAPLVPPAGDLYVVKKRWSAFFGTALDGTLRRLGVRQVVVCGVQTPNCIRQTAFDAVALDYACVVLRDASAAASYEVHEANLLDMHNAGVAVASTHDWAVALALKAVSPAALGTLLGVGLAQGGNLAGAGVNAAMAGMASLFSGAAFQGGAAGGGTPGAAGGGGAGVAGGEAQAARRSEDGGDRGGATPDKRGTDSGFSGGGGQGTPPPPSPASSRGGGGAGFAS